ncbi:MAG: ABC transporter substrate-binding protein [Alphaproteobacteria bacterium]|nr:ABC transporter substrate-binding protein [Alphaproteobacteria bacterium]
MQFGPLVAVATLALALVVSAEAKTVKVGIVATFSGNGAELGQQIERGYELYLRLHVRDIAPHTIEIVKRDSKRPDGAEAKNAVLELIAREKVDVLAGFVFSPDAMSSAPLATQGKVPMIIMNAGTAWIPKLSPYIARVSFSMWQAGYVMGEYAAEKMGHKTAIIGVTDYPPGKDSADAFRLGFESKGGKIVDQMPIGGPAEVPDFTPYFQRVKDAKPNAFYVFVPSGNHATAVVKTYANLGMRAAGIELIGPGDITPDSSLQEMGDGAVGLIVVHHYSADYDTPENKAFVKAWKDSYGANSTPDFMGVQGYDGMAAIMHAVKKLDGNMDGDKVMDALKGWKFASPRGPIMINPDTRDIIQNEYVHKIIKDGARLKVSVISKVDQVKDQCIELKVGRCGQ